MSAKANNSTFNAFVVFILEGMLTKKATFVAIQILKSELFHQEFLINWDRVYPKPGIAPTVRLCLSLGN